MFDYLGHVTTLTIYVYMQLLYCATLNSSEVFAAIFEEIWRQCWGAWLIVLFARDHHAWCCLCRERERYRVSLKMPNTGIACRTVSVEVRVETWFERLMQMQLQPDMDCATQLKDERPDSMV